jgi:gliding motility-associated-like protein
MNSLFHSKIKAAAVLLICSSFLFQSNAVAQCSMLAPLTSVCENISPVTLTGGTPLGGVYFGPGVSPTPPYTFDPVGAGGAGMYQIGYAEAGCGDTAFQFINVFAKPAAVLIVPTPLCSNADSILLNGGSPVPPPGTGLYYGPGVDSGTEKFGPNIGGGAHDVNYVYTDLNGCKDTATSTITVTDVLPADFSGLDTAYCLEDPSPVTLTQVVPAAGGIFEPAALFTGNDFNIPVTPSTYQISFRYTDANGCSDTAFKSVRIRPKPAVTFSFATGQNSVCEKDAAFVIALTNASPANGSFSGTGIIGTNVFNPQIGVGTYRIAYTAFGPLGCENVDSSKFITVKPSPTVSFDLPVDSICENDPAINLPNGTINGSPGSGNFTYSGTGVSSAAPYKFNPTTAGVGTHSITYEGVAAQCTTATVRTIKVNPKPILNFANIIKVCANEDPFALTVGLPEGGIYFGTGVTTDGLSYDPSTTPGPGLYDLSYTYTDELGCADTISQSLTLDTFPVVSITSIPTLPKICQGDTIELNATGTPSSSTFVWGPNSGDIVPPASGDNIFAYPFETKTYTLTGLYKACEGTSTITVEVIPPAVAVIDGDLEICIGDSTTLTASGASTYQWDHGPTDPILNEKPYWDTTYSVIALSDMDGAGKQCSQDTTDVVVIVNPLPIISAGLDTTAFIGDRVPLLARGAETYVWSGEDSDVFGCIDCASTDALVLQPSDRSFDVIYTVTGTDANGCINSDDIVITIDEKVIVFVPTAFSPNNDGANDSLYVRGKGIKSIDLQIFNRRGEEIFATKNIKNGWDGTYKGAPLNKEVFVYYLTVTPYIRPPFKQTGSITLVR